MRGWTGRALRVDLTRRKHMVQELDPHVLVDFIGGRGLAAWTLWTELPPGADPLGPHNKLIVAAGPLTGIQGGPNSGKVVVAAKSPLTGGYGDGNIGTWLAVNMRRAGYDAIIVEGRANRPTYLYIENEKAHFMDADHLWGLNTWSTEDKLLRAHGRDAGGIYIGPAGERQVKFATVVSLKGRSGGRPGIGAVMGSKMLKAIVVRGTGKLPVDAEEAAKASSDAVREGRTSKAYDFWMRQGTTMTVEWAQEASVLPAYNFNEAQFDGYERIGGNMVERYETDLKSCPICFMPCGHWIPAVSGTVETDYENIAMLGSNLGIDDLTKVGELNRIADVTGMDTISLGSALAVAMEATEMGLLKDLGLKAEWGDFNAASQLALDIAYRRGPGSLFAEGSAYVAKVLGHEDLAMHVKGLDVSAYDSRAAPAMALAFATSPIGAHHKDAWVISQEVRTDRFSYSPEKAEWVIAQQRIRGGWFEAFVSCRFPWVELGVSLDHYVRLIRAVTGVDYTHDRLNLVADRIYALIRAFWIRELGGWTRSLDMPPPKWFKRPLTRGPLAGTRLDLDKYNGLLDHYYRLRGWDNNGVPRRSTLKALGLGHVANQIEKYVEVYD